jgi:hypothetical protein
MMEGVGAGRCRAHAASMLVNSAETDWEMAHQSGQGPQLARQSVRRERFDSAPRLIFFLEQISQVDATHRRLYFRLRRDVVIEAIDGRAIRARTALRVRANAPDGAQAQSLPAGGDDQLACIGTADGGQRPMAERGMM